MELSKSTSILHFKKAIGDNSFVGLKINGNDITFCYPETFNFDEQNPNKYDVISLLKSITLSKKKNDSNISTFIGTNGISDYAIDSYIWLINDYLVNGFYRNREKVVKTNSTGVVNWKRTLDTTPIISKSKQVIYNKLIVSTTENVDNIIVNIHKYCLKKSIDLIGWIFDISSDFIDDIFVNDEIKSNFLNIINKEISVTFDDNKKLRLFHMKNVLIGLDSELNTQQLEFGVSSYHQVFEVMIDKLFGNANVKEFYPKTIYTDSNGNVVSAGELRPDTVVISQDKLFILDAKYYRYGVTKNLQDLPNATSIQKQIQYGTVAESKHHEFSKIYNAFIIPYNKNLNPFNCTENVLCDEIICRFDNNPTKTYELIRVFLIDLKYLVNKYNKYNKEQDILYLTSMIEQAVDSLL